ncbi:hypothetical protein [Gimesia panareensis]|uniref:Pentapeptide repeats (8 copies) n=1 Tax=Gimesia panareensis TaxID=2527978 RepID=A0A518A1I9_9PLAN|nr:hypothetical protein [Gimesia panareensis]QDT25651.1 hypothetical protein Enr10x_09480 [Gimesia panareensis]QDU48596.1 hypothetical protein Pan110_09110 [Gimesia panareensis]QDV18251.1 hypothetical protein Pan153_29080 [Gimesia panareensis]
MNQLQQDTIEDTELVLDDKEQHYLGPSLVLNRCQIILRTNANALTITDVRISDCHIEAKKKLTNFQMWCAAKLRGCTFAGWYVGNDFGHWAEQNPNGAIEDCDFSKAILDGCRFMDCNAESIVFPKWPCFTILHPAQHRKEIELVDWPGTLRIWANVVAASLDITTASVGYAPTVAKQFDSTEDELRSTLEGMNCVKM